VPKKNHATVKKANAGNHADKQKQGPFNKVLIVGLGPSHRSLPDVVGLYRFTLFLLKKAILTLQDSFL
jgi:hypothetical protein